MILFNTSSPKTNIYLEGVAMFSPHLITNNKLINIAKTKYKSKHNIK